MKKTAKTRTKKSPVVPAVDLLTIARQMVAKVTTYDRIYSAILEDLSEGESETLFEAITADFNAKYPRADVDEILKHEKFLIGIAIGEHIGGAR